MKLFTFLKDHSGYCEVSEGKKWKQICQETTVITQVSDDVSHHQGSGSQSGAPGSAAASPGHWLEMHILRPYTSPTESQALGWDPAKVALRHTEI